LALLLPMVIALAPALADGKGGEKLRVGTQRLTPCKDYPKTWCGSLRVPLDRDDATAGTIDIGYAWRPAGGRSRGTLVANEGGPGYPSLTSMALWRGMYGTLLKERDLLVVDARGTGMSEAIDCPALQAFDDSQADGDFFQTIAACGEQLNSTYKKEGGAFVHASDLFGTVDAVDDMALVIEALGVGPVDLYGDSYGSFFAQAFAARHPGLLRSLTLDGTWPLIDANPWYPETPATLRFAFDAVCQRSAACNAAAPGSATARLGELATFLEANPQRGEVPGPDGEMEAVPVKATDLAALAWSAGSDGGIYRDLDAAGRAAMAGDPAPLLRIAARAGLNGALAGGWSADTYSVGHAVAVPCTDYPQAFDMSASPEERERQFAAAVAALSPAAFAPFSNDQWLQNPIQDYNQCVPWPSPTHERALAPNGLPLVPASIPVLILAGDLDSVTAMGGAETAAAQLGPSARLVVFPSSTHVVAQGDIVGCGSAILREFLRAPERLAELDVSCAASFPEIRAVGLFPQTVSEQPLPVADAGNAASEQELRLAAVAIATAGDAIAYPPARDDRGAGLRDGTILANKSRKPRVLTLRDVRYASDAVVNGTVRLPENPAAPVVANLTAEADDGTRVKIKASWKPLEQNAIASATGTAGQGKTPLKMSMPAP